MTTAKVGPTQTPDVPLCPACYGFFMLVGKSWWHETYDRKKDRDEQMEYQKAKGHPVRPFVVPAETADDRKEAP